MLAETVLRRFLADVLPTDGICTAFSLPDGKHHRCGTHTELAAKIEALDKSPEHAAVYFGCASYRQSTYRAADGKQKFRTQENVEAAKSFWMDLDCGKAKAEADKGYPTKDAAWRAVKDFCIEYGLPLPTHVVDSGHGLHIYWALSEAIHGEVWTKTAEKLHTLSTKAGLRADPSRTKDRASVLRPPETTNRKDKGAPKRVQLKHRGTPIVFSEFDATLTAALSASCSTALPPAPLFMAGQTGNLDGTGPVRADARSIADKCPQIANFASTGGESEPLWRAGLGVIKHCKDGERIAHDWSAKDSRYDHDETQEKLDNWTTGPTTCAKFRELAPSWCDGCKHKCKSPIQLGYEYNTDGGSWLGKMNASYAYITKDAAIYRIEYRDFLSPEKFHIAHANETVGVAAGSGTKQVPVSGLWLRDKNRRQHEAIVTRPGEPEVTAEGCLNDWAGFSVEPTAGDVRPFLRLYAYLFGDERFLQLWLAHLIQHPGTKMFVALVVWSQAEGVGKNLFFETVGALFNRRHFALIGQSEVDDDFCGWIPGKVFAVGDEIRTSKSDKSKDRLKLWQTSTTLRTHDKGQPKREVENLMNMVFLSNHADGMFLSDYDRRFYVHEVKSGPLPETIKREFLAWRENNGLAYLLHHLQQIDLDGFDPKGRAPLTASKVEMIEASRSDLDRWAHDVVGGALPVGKEVATGEELTKRFCLEYPNLRQPPSVATVCKVLIRAGAVRRDNQIRLTNGRKVRGLALLRAEYWKDAPESAWRDELEKVR